MTSYEVKKKFKNTKARTGVLKVNNIKIKTPTFWLGILYQKNPYPWNYFKSENVLLNAYDILSKNKKKNIGPIRKHLKFNSTVLMDSGGFLFQKSEDVLVSPQDILDFYKQTKPDIGVVLDHPFSTIDYQNNFKRWKTTLKNTKFMLENSHDIALMPVIHGYDIKTIKKSCCQVKRICEPEMVGLGSIVPLIKSFKTSNISDMNGKTSIEFLIEAIKLVREEFEDSFLHVFGVGGTTTMNLMYGLGVDSIDSIGWRMKAAYGAIQFPGVADRFISPKGRRRGMIQKDFSLLEICECPICKGKTLDEKIQQLDNSLYGTFSARAIHNAYTFNHEKEEFIKNLNKNNINPFVEERLSNTRFCKAYHKFLSN